MAYPLSETRAEALRSAEHLQTLRQKAQSVSRQTVLPGQPEMLWPVLSWNDLLNQAIGMQITENSYLTLPSGQTWMHASTRNGGFPVAYEELPYEWSAPHRYHVERIHSKGPLKYLRFAVDLKAINDTETEVTCTLDFVSILPAFVVKQLSLKELKAFLKLFRQLAETLASGDPTLKAFFTPNPTQTEHWQTRWESIVPEPSIRQAIASYVICAPERLAYRLRPEELAKAYGLDPLETLKSCLYLARENFLHLRWDCRCPSCKGPKESSGSLTDLKAQAYCPTCAVNYGIAFDQNVELTFQPTAQVRPTSERYFCAGSPGNTPHIAWQQYFQPHEQRSFTLDLPPGGYILRSLSSANEVVIWLLDDSAYSEALNELTLNLNQAFDRAETVILKPGAKLHLTNANTYAQTLMLEALNWQADAVTAADVQSVQAFHDLFPEQVLAAGESLPLQSQTLLYVHLDNLAVLPEGCEAELNSWIQQHIQAHEGAAVISKTGDLIGVFKTPFEALSTAWSLSQEVSDLGLLYETPIALRGVIGTGPCEVFTEGAQLMYRGALFTQLTERLPHLPGPGFWVQALSEDLATEFLPLLGTGERHADGVFYALNPEVEGF